MCKVASSTRSNTAMPAFQNPAFNIPEASVPPPVYQEKFAKDIVTNIDQLHDCKDGVSEVVGANVLSKLTIPTTTGLISSGFPYKPALQALNISPSDWALFTRELQTAVSPTHGQKFVALLSGVVTVCFIAEPWTASRVGRWVWCSQTVKNAQRGLQEKNHSSVGDCRWRRETVCNVLARWNVYWAAQGVILRLEVSKGGRSEEQKDENGEGGEIRGSQVSFSLGQSNAVVRKGCCAVGRKYFQIVLLTPDGSLAQSKDEEHIFTRGMIEKEAVY